MSSGFGAGAFWGTLGSVTALVTASLVAEQPAGNTPPGQPGLTAGDIDPVSPRDGGGEVSTVAGDPGGAPAPSVTPDVSRPEQSTPPVVADTDPLAPPTTGEVAELAVPAIEGAPELSAGTEAPVLPSPQSQAPVLPDQEQDIAVETTPAPPPAPVLVDVPDESADEAPVVIVADADAAEAEDEASSDAIADALTRLTDEEGEGEAASGEVDLADADAAETDGAEPGIAADAGEDALPVVDTEVPSAPEAVAEADTTAPTLTQPEVDTQMPVTPGSDDAPLIALQGEDAGLPGDGSEAVVVRRLTDGAEQDAEVATADAAPEVMTTEALSLYAASVEVPHGASVLSMILIDDGSLSGATDVVAALPFAASVAIDPSRADATEVMQAYRDAGIEVFALAQVPDGARPSDTEVILQASFAQLPEAIGLIDVGQARLQDDRATAEMAMARLADEGRGFVATSSGLNPALRAAASADVPAAMVYRQLDADDEDANVIRRYLDQASFRARNQGGVVLVGRLRADTISALTLWASSAQGDGGIFIAPVSVLLLSE